LLGGDAAGWRPGREARVAGVVLVHGLWHAPGHFDLVAGELRAAGVEVAAPELHRGSLRADPGAVQGVVDAMGEPPLVLGHSYGGSVITGLTGAAHLVYLAAFVPSESESTAGLARDTDLIGPVVTRRDDGSTRLDPEKARDALYGDCSAERAAWAVGLLRPQRPGHGRGVPHRAAWRDTPSTYVVCTQDRAVDPGLQAQLARRCGSTRTWPTGHSPFLSRPDLVVSLVTELVEASSA
jgi:pimeloyl-ACP methyl ester carboxylesterase